MLLSGRLLLHYGKGAVIFIRGVLMGTRTLARDLRDLREEAGTDASEDVHNRKFSPLASRPSPSFSVHVTCTH